VLMKLGSVKGSSAPEVWRYMTEATGDSSPTWNFSAKYLVSKTGEVSIARDVEKDIEKLMEE